MAHDPYGAFAVSFVDGSGKHGTLFVWWGEDAKMYVDCGSEGREFLREAFSILAEQAVFGKAFGRL